MRAVLPFARIHALNIAEVVKKLAEIHVPEKEIELSLEEIQIPVIEDFSLVHALAVGKLAAMGRKFELSLGDSVCLETARSNGATAVTAERRWATIPDIGSNVLLIR